MAFVRSTRDEFFAALKADLGKTDIECLSAEYTMVLADCKQYLATIKALSQPQPRASHVALFPASARVERLPLGPTLIISPFNYPISLALQPLAAAIAAGCPVVIKPSELTPACARYIATVCDALPSTWCCLGAVETSTRLLNVPWRHIFFTGSTTVGKIVAAAGARHLSRVTLELGGKSPCVLCESANVEAAARRIVWGKAANAGQTCVAPDFIVADDRLQPALLPALAREYARQFPNGAADMTRIVAQRHFDRARGIVASARARCGMIESGLSEAPGFNLAPEDRELPLALDLTVFYGSPDAVLAPEARLMQEELFCPVLPVIFVKSAHPEQRDNVQHLIDVVHRAQTGFMAVPLALYVFAERKKQSQAVVAALESGGCAINDCVTHLLPANLPFGGMAESGLGSYHGQAGFLRFSHERSVLMRGTGAVQFDSVRFTPATPLALSLIERVM
eukprot:gnl/Ergobibamus_cyprinoides/839.p1 GENE.gnl/Ergobibamus_cyprinoides/839~~gnl/Ergobibamus_cyprinoides/839.p1  ORF type:complete len:501 (+),score=135.20 gnl/Ergobibamus_cyprinoides/839:146-1504(+)